MYIKVTSDEEREKQNRGHSGGLVMYLSDPSVGLGEAGDWKISVSRCRDTSYQSSLIVYIIDLYFNNKNMMLYYCYDNTKSFEWLENNLAVGENRYQINKDNNDFIFKLIMSEAVSYLGIKNFGLLLKSQYDNGYRDGKHSIQEKFRDLLNLNY